MVFTFHHRDPGAWHALTTALLDAGFIITAVSPIRAKGVSGFHSYEGTPKWDAVVCCRKRRVGKTAFRDTMIDDIRKVEAVWTQRLRKRRISWSDADRASLGYALPARGPARLESVSHPHRC